MIVGMSMVPPAPPAPRPRRRRGSAPVLTPGDKLMGATFSPSQGFRWGDKPMGESGRQALAGLNFLNPLASVTERVLGGESPRFSDFAVDAGLLAAGLVPFVGPGLRAGGQAAKAGAGLTVTGTGDAGRLSALVRRLNKSDDVSDFMTERGLKSKERPNEPNEGLFRPGARGDMDYGNVPDAASPYTFGLVPTERLLPLREFDRAAEEAGQGVFGPDNVNKLIEHLASGGRLDDPAAVLWDPTMKWGYLGDGNHRLAAAAALGLEKLPATVRRSPGAKKVHVDDMLYKDEMLLPPSQRTPLSFVPNYFKLDAPIGRNFDVDPAQLRKSDLDRGGMYVPPTMHPYLFPYLRPN